MANDTTRVALIISGTMLTIFGLMFLSISKPLLAVYGVDLDATGVRIFRMGGGAVLALGALGILARNLDEPSQRLAGKSLLCYYSLKSVVAFEAVLGGMFNSLGWSILAIDIPMAIFWTWVLLKRGRESRGAVSG